MGYPVLSGGRQGGNLTPSLLGPDAGSSCSPTGDLKKCDRTSSSGTMSSSEELADQEGAAGAGAFEQGEDPPLPLTSGDGRKLGRACPAEPNPSLPAEDLNAMAPELPVVMPSGPFRHVGMSKAARTHRLRKLRTPAKCRECNSYVYFQGAECEEVRVPAESTVWGASSKEGCPFWCR